MIVTLLAGGISATSLVIRRRTWHMRGEGGASFAVGALATSTYLLDEDCSIGPALYHATGWGYLDDFGGHLLWVFGLIGLLHHGLHRLAGHDEQVEIFDALVRWPVTLMVPLMLSAMFTSSALHAEPTGSLALIEGGNTWLCIYRTIWYSCTLYLTILLMRILLAVRRTGDGPRRYVDMYLGACWFTVLAIFVRIVAFWPTFSGLRYLPRYATYVATVLVALAAGLSWLGKLWAYRRLLRETRTSRRELRSDTLQSHRDRLMLAAPFPPPEPLPPPPCVFDGPPPETSLS
ncbi:membrane protein [Mycobacterium phage SirPhilip]|uniref:Membrane protein n=1 Tax=Mycobacterium phage SirPhilip TaxID=2015824 RepID=A0A222ZKI6_9CAUD|nr:membrane protein [Mycobacterium phage SirPhilip]ASR85246.1 membrane protein [Mycobacterium phage SirPhilip]